MKTSLVAALLTSAASGASAAGETVRFAVTVRTDGVVTDSPSFTAAGGSFEFTDPSKHRRFIAVASRAD